MNGDSLKLISLNAWGGRALYPLMRFLQAKASEMDIFCPQEMFNTEQDIIDERHSDEYLCGPLFKKASANLPDFNGVFACLDGKPHMMSLAMFLRKEITLKKVSDMVVHHPAQPQETGSRVFSERKLQYAIMGNSGKECAIINFHGLWNAGPKTDTPERIEQSKQIKKFMDSLNMPKILCGDFNLLPDTESMKILEDGMINLIKETNTPSTRTLMYRHRGESPDSNFADYILVSPNIKINAFKVLPDLVSDHAPLFLEFSL